MYQDQTINALGEYNEIQLSAFSRIRKESLKALKRYAKGAEYKEITTSSLLDPNILRDKKPNLFSLNYSEKGAQMCQKNQMELQRYMQSTSAPKMVYSYGMSPDSEASFSKFTLIEFEKTFHNECEEGVLKNLLSLNNCVIATITRHLLHTCADDIALLGGKIKYLEKVASQPFKRITYEQALAILKREGYEHPLKGPLCLFQQTVINRVFNNQPVFMTHLPGSMKSVCTKRYQEDAERTYSFDLLIPRLGTLSSGAIKETNVHEIETVLSEVDITMNQNSNIADIFKNYLKVCEREHDGFVAGFGFGLEDLMGFLVNSSRF